MTTLMFMLLLLLLFIVSPICVWRICAIYTLIRVVAVIRGLFTRDDGEEMTAPGEFDV